MFVNADLLKKIVTGLLMFEALLYIVTFLKNIPHSLNVSCTAIVRRSVDDNDVVVRSVVILLPCQANTGIARTARAGLHFKYDTVSEGKVNPHVNITSRRYVEILV